MLKKFLLVFLFTAIIFPTAVEARDPYPNKTRVEYIVPPQSAQQPYDHTVTDPQTMMRTNGKRSDIISFSCFKANASPPSIYYTDPGTDSASKVTCATDRVLRPPYLKNNKTTPECLGKTYDAACYDWPIGNFLGPHLKAGKGDAGWINSLSYVAEGGPLNACGVNKNERCDCQYVPYGPPSTWIQITSGTKRCVAPPYSTSGPWWDWFIGEMDTIRNTKNLDEIDSVSVNLGMDGEGRPFKSGEGWGPDPGFYSNFVPAVIREVKKRYPGKTINTYYTRDINFFLENDLDFHWESLSSDGAQEYLYRGLPPEGYDQIYQNYFYKTNTLGLNPDWPPYYQDMMSALSKHTDGTTGFMDLFEGLYQDGKGDFIKFAGSYIGKNINNTPGVWDNLRDTQWKKEATADKNKSGKYGDYLFYLYRMEDLEGNHTQAVSTADLPLGTSSQIYNYGLPLVRYGFPTNNLLVGRKNTSGNNYISFDIDDGYRYTQKIGVSFDVRIVYLDTGTNTFKFQYKDVNNQLKEHPITKTDTKLWKEVIFTLNDAYFNNNMSDYPYPTDFRIETNGTTFHLVEVVGKGAITDQVRPKVQVSCDLVKNEADDPKEGINTVSLNQNLKVKARLADNNGNPIPAERVMFTYNSEWNWAKSIKTNSSGLAFFDLSLANNVNRSGFVGDGGRPDLPSWYSIQVFYPGSDKYQPSRNDCKLPIYTSSSAQDVRMKITNIDTSKVASTGKATVSYQILNSTNGVIATGQKGIGKAESFFVDDPNAQTVLITWFDNAQNYRYAFNNITIRGTGNAYPTSTPPITGANTPTPTPTGSSLATLSLRVGINNIVWQSNYPTVKKFSAVPAECPMVFSNENGFWKIYVKNYGGDDLTFKANQSYDIRCETGVEWKL